MNDPIPRPGPLPEWLEFVQKQVAAMQYGTIHLIVHDSKVLQIETTEKVRFDKPETKSRPH